MSELLPWVELDLPDVPWLLMLGCMLGIAALFFLGNRRDTALEKDDEA